MARDGCADRREATSFLTRSLECARDGFVRFLRETLNLEQVRAVDAPGVTHIKYEVVSEAPPEP